MMTRAGPSERFGEIDRLQRNPNVNLLVTSRVVPCVTVDPLVGRPSRVAWGGRTVTDRFYDVPCDCGAAA
jgi:hypothetical protein